LLKQNIKVNFVKNLKKMKIITNSVAEYITAKERRRNVYTKIENGKMTYWHYDRWIGKRQFELYYPIVEYKPLKPIND
jgi:hypothetical protein